VELILPSEPGIITREALRIVKGIEAVNGRGVAGISLQVGHKPIDHHSPSLFAGIRRVE
jgi:hypothetical protein